MTPLLAGMFSDSYSGRGSIPIAAAVVVTVFASTEECTLVATKKNIVCSPPCRKH